MPGPSAPIPGAQDARVMGTGDPWMSSETPSQGLPGVNPLPLGTLLSWQDRCQRQCLCPCAKPCIVTRTGHALHVC